MSPTRTLPHEGELEVSGIKFFLSISLSLPVVWGGPILTAALDRTVLHVENYSQEVVKSRGKLETVTVQDLGCWGQRNGTGWP